MSEPRGRGGDNVVTRTVERIKQHPVVAAIAALVALFAFFNTVAELYERFSSTAQELINPHEEDYKKLAELDLGVTPAYLKEWLGEPRRSSDLCLELPCPPDVDDQAVTISMYESDLVAVRALYVGPSLDWYAVTLLSDELRPQMTWLGHELGSQGEVTYSDALQVPGVEPTDVDMFLGPQASSYVEIVAVGAPADYRGLLLASAPTGWSGAGSFDRESADAVTPLNEAPYDSHAAEPFRSNSRPNTFGEFLDDGGIVSQLARDAEFNRVLLFTFTA
jgi:hypothetical protein